jgi:hypothetical protein
MPALEGSRGSARFEGFELDLRAGELRPLDGENGRKAVRLAEQPLLILTMLLERPGHVVTREEIRKRLWPNDTIVEFEHSIRGRQSTRSEHRPPSCRSRLRASSTCSSTAMLKGALEQRDPRIPAALR